MFEAVFFCLCLLIEFKGVFGDNSDELKTVLGDSVTLHTDVTEIQRDDQILWMFGPRNTRIAGNVKSDQINFIWVSNDEIFRDKLQLNNQTGSLTIKNITITHTGLYQLEMINDGGTSVKRFSVTVYARLPVPIITRVSSRCSSSSESSTKCVLLCSVVNVTPATLSWYKGNSLLSSISVSDLNNSLSLPLEVEYQENNIYSCVINNPIRNQTKHLNINEVCQTCSEQTRSYLISLTVAVVLVLLVIIAVIGIMMFRHMRVNYHVKRSKIMKERNIKLQQHSVQHHNTSQKKNIAFLAGDAENLYNMMQHSKIIQKHPSDTWTRPTEIVQERVLCEQPSEKWMSSDWL